MRFFHSLRVWPLVATGALLGSLTGCTWHSVEPEFCFETEIQPIFVSYCSTTGCHNPTDRVEGYDFTNYAGLMEAIRPGRPGGSKLFEAMMDKGDDQMPPPGTPRPSAQQIALIEAWIQSGAENTRNCAGGNCDTSGVVTYSQTIQPMLETRCLGCHGGGSPSGGLDFSNFTTLRQAALSGRLEGSLTGSPTYASMPPNSAPLPACNIYQVQKWIAAGAPQN